MIDVGIVRGSEYYARPVVVKPDAVYVHTDIRLVEPVDGMGLDEERAPEYEYHEYKYTLEEYQEHVNDQIAQHSSAITDVEVGVAESFEHFDGITAANSNSITDLEVALAELFEMTVGGN